MDPRGRLSCPHAPPEKSIYAATKLQTRKKGVGRRGWNGMGIRGGAWGTAICTQRRPLFSTLRVKRKNYEAHPAQKRQGVLGG